MHSGVGTMRSILVIDDEQPTLEMLALLLEAQGYNVLTAADGSAGMAAFERHSPPMVLTDIKMPGIDGLEVLRRIKAKSPATEVIVITGHGDVDLAMAALNLKATDFIDKPISQAALQAALRRSEERIDRLTTNDSPARMRQTPDAMVLDITGTFSGTFLNTTGSHQPATTGSTAEPAQGALNTSDKPLLINVSDCASINGAGIATLGRMIQEARGKGRAVAIACPAENFRRVFSASGLTRLASLHESEDLAAQALRARIG